MWGEPYGSLPHESECKRTDTPPQRNTISPVSGRYGIITTKSLLYRLSKIYHNGALRLWYNNRRAVIILKSCAEPRRRGRQPVLMRNYTILVQAPSWYNNDKAVIIQDLKGPFSRPLRGNRKRWLIIPAI